MKLSVPEYSVFNNGMMPLKLLPRRFRRCAHKSAVKSYSKDSNNISIRFSDQNCRLLQLLGEIRNKIYAYALSESDGLFCRNGKDGPPKLYAAHTATQESNQLKYVCRRMYWETKGLGLQYNDLVLVRTSENEAFLFHYTRWDWKQDSLSLDPIGSRFYGLHLQVLYRDKDISHLLYDSSWIERTKELAKRWFQGRERLDVPNLRHFPQEDEFDENLLQESLKRVISAGDQRVSWVNGDIDAWVVEARDWYRNGV
ncbi:hypothetical protein K469DRAFT_758459 [Zopfia rhizophila CBS 207.26]|uniref:Uncharacterized protein n=1 Tax=Zopfia rhizophila CBS 207.26 TaxID=1314779 RepID=A0A6A6EXE4_9PEZI|nr:hypothetical protein K469DRAFT_758459 [Zopfia rhizophila CBS 207.26]